MNRIKAIRERLGVTQEALGEAIGCTQGNVGHYERGQPIPSQAAKRLIAFAHSRGQAVTYEDIYGPALEPEVIASAANHPTEKARA
jgi:putative transcriptional regulator